jgi:hypothetical protein
MDGENSMITAEDAVFELERAAWRVEVAASALAALASRLQAVLPEGVAGDLARPIAELGRRLRTLADETVERVRADVMDIGVPLDDVACRSCDSATFAMEQCEACSAVRSDGLRLARRMAGWMV